MMLSASSFVGRRVELQQIGTGFDVVLAGTGRLFVIVGEPGIGKSRLAAELANSAHSRAMQTLWARCWDAGSAPALWPWQQLLEAAIVLPQHRLALETLPPATLDNLSRIVPVLGESRRRDSPSREPAPYEKAELLDALVRLMHAFSHTAPMLLIFEDLHQADKLSREMLVHLSGHLHEMPLAIVATMRSIEGASILSEIVRHGTYIPLTGLNPGEVGTLIVNNYQVAVEPAQLPEIHNLTGGNPLFVDGVAPLFLNKTREGIPTPGRALEMPVEIRRSVLSRLAPMSADTHRLLYIASAAGNEFDAAAIALAADVSIEIAITLLQEAIRQRLIWRDPSNPQRFHFFHALIRDALYGDIPPDQRSHTHLSIANCLERLYADSLDDHIESIAYHYVEASSAAAIPRAINYLSQAAERAMARFAYDAAIKHAERAVAVAEQSVVNPPVVAAALLLLGRAQLRGGLRQRANDTFERTVAYCRVHGLPNLFGTAALFRGSGVGSLVDAESDLTAIELLEEALNLLPLSMPGLRARCLARLSIELCRTTALERSRTLARQACDDAEHLEDEHIQLEAGLALAWALAGPDALDERRQRATTCLRLAIKLNELESEFHARHVLLEILLTLGDGDAIDTEISTCERIAGKLQQATLNWQTRIFRVMRSLMSGRIAQAAALAEQAHVDGQIAVGAIATRTYITEQYDLAWAEGRFRETLDGFRTAAEQSPHSLAWLPGFIHACIDAGRISEAQNLLSHAVLSLDHFPRDAYWLSSITILAEDCARLGDTASAEPVLKQLTPFAGQAVVTLAGRHCMGSVSRVLGMLCATLRRWDEALAHFEDALELDTRLGAFRWHAYGLCDQATALLARDEPGDRAHATSLLRSAQRWALEMDVQGVSKRSQELLSGIGAIPDCAAPTAYTVLFVDDHPIYTEGLSFALKHLLDNTRLISALNGDEAMKILTEIDVDLVLTDFRMPGEDGLELRRRIATSHPSVAVGLLCADPRPEIAGRARELGAVSYLSKERNIASMADAIRRLLAGETIFDSTAPPADATGISDRRLEILRMGARGLSNKEIARLLNVGERTVKDHWSVIFERMGVKNRIQAISVAHARGLLHEGAPS